MKRFADWKAKMLKHILTDDNPMNRAERIHQVGLKATDLVMAHQRAGIDPGDGGKTIRLLRLIDDGLL